MTTILSSIDTYIHEIEKQIPTHIYSILCEYDIDTNKKHLLMIDEKLTQYMIKLDEITTIDRQERKQKIMKIQQIQKSIDKVIKPKIISKNIEDIDVYKLKKISAFIHQQNYKINELKLTNAELSIQIEKLTRSQCINPTMFA